MIQKLQDYAHYIRSTFENLFRLEDYYLSMEEQTYSDDEVVISLKFILSTHAIDYRSIVQIEHPLRVITQYLMGSNRIDQVEELMLQEQDQMLSTSKYVIHMYKNYLEKVVPANITFYHFIREKEYYAHMVALRYFMVVGITQKSNILSKFKHENRCEMFQLFLDWLYNLIKYRCSAIYLSSSCVDPLIYQTNLVLASLLGYDQQSLLGSLLEHELNEVFNKILYISCYILAVSIPQNNYLQINIVLIVLRKIYKSTMHQKVTEFLPSYLFAKSIGYLPAPYSHEVIYRLLINFAIKIYQQITTGSEDQLLSNQNYHKYLLIDAWSVLLLMVEQYSNLDSAKLKELINLTISKLEPQSMVRAFLVRIAFNLHLDVSDQKIKKYMAKNKVPYFYHGKILTLQTFCKNYHIVMQREYFSVLHESARGRILKLDDNLIWQSTLTYNKYEILNQSEYLQRMSLSPSSKCIES